MSQDKTREEAQARLLAYGAKLHRPMQHMIDLDNAYPAIGMFEPICISAEVGQGWAGILNACLSAMNKHGYTARQVKSKFCVLTIYWAEPEGLSAEAKAEVEGVYNAAVNLSQYVCEDCGGYAPEGAGKPMSGRRQCDECKAAK